MSMNSVVSFLEKAKLIILLMGKANRDSEYVFKIQNTKHICKNMTLQIRVIKTW